jgi:O-antigen/teichoic acid export membrane protein
MTTVLFPRLASRFFASSDERRIKAVSLAAYWTISLVILAALTVLSAPLLRLVVGVDVRELGVNAPLLFFLTGSGVVCFGAARIVSVELFVRQRTGRVALIWAFAALLNIALNLALVPSFALNGVGAANMLSYLAFLGAVLAYVRYGARPGNP